MQYISTKPLELPKAMTMEDETGATLAGIVRYLLEAYQPRQSLTLDVGELRSVNKVLDVLEQEDTDGYYAIEDADMSVISKVVNKFAPGIMVSHPRNIPAIVDALEACPKEKPE